MGLPHPGQGLPGWGKVEKKEEKQVEEKRMCKDYLFYFVFIFLFKTPQAVGVSAQHRCVQSNQAAIPKVVKETTFVHFRG